MPAEAQKVHGLSSEFLTGKPKFHEIADRFLEFVGDSPVIAHNAAFDRSFVNFELEKCGRGAAAGKPLGRHPGHGQEALPGHVQLARRAL
jgi:DNA polymerase III epsilon subunit-like protein